MRQIKAALDPQVGSYHTWKFGLNTLKSEDVFIMLYNIVFLEPDESWKSVFNTLTQFQVNKLQFYCAQLELSKLIIIKKFI